MRSRNESSGDNDASSTPSVLPPNKKINRLESPIPYNLCSNSNNDDNNDSTYLKEDNSESFSMDCWTNGNDKYCNQIQERQLTEKMEESNDGNDDDNNNDQKDEDSYSSVSDIIEFYQDHSGTKEEAEEANILSEKDLILEIEEDRDLTIEVHVQKEEDEQHEEEQKFVEIFGPFSITNTNTIEEINQLKLKLKFAEIEISNLKENLKDSNQDRDDSISKYRGVMDSLELSNAEIKSKQMRIDTCNKENENLREDVLLSHRQTSIAEIKINQLEQSNLFNENQLRDVWQKMTLMSETVSSSQQEVLLEKNISEKIKNEINKKSSELSLLQQDYKEIQSKLQSNQEILDNTKIITKDLEKQYWNCLDINKDNESKNKILIEKLNIEIKQLNYNHLLDLNKIEILNKNFEEKTLELNIKSNEIIKISDNNLMLKNEIQGNKNIINKQQNDLLNKDNQIEEKNNCIKDIKNELEESKQHIIELNNLAKELQEQRLNMSVKLEISASKIKELESKIEEKETNIEKHKELISFINKLSGDADKTKDKTRRISDVSSKHLQNF
jgi:hypothetical protein